MQNSIFTITTLVFLMVAPAPDSRDIVEMSADFLVPTSHSVLLASDKPFQINLLVAHPDSNSHSAKFREAYIKNT